MTNHSFHHDNWKWIRIDMASSQDITSLPNLPSAAKSWVEAIKEEKNSNLEMETTEEGMESVWGSILYHQDIEKQSKKSVLQYYVSDNTLITSMVDSSLLYRVSERDLLAKMQTAGNAIEGFMILLGEIVASFLQDIDAFENQMNDLLWRLAIQFRKAAITNGLPGASAGAAKSSVNMMKKLVK